MLLELGLLSELHELNYAFKPRMLSVCSFFEVVTKGFK